MRATLAVACHVAGGSHPGMKMPKSRRFRGHPGSTSRFLVGWHGLRRDFREGESMPQRDVYQCQCSSCTGPDLHPDREIHSRMNLLMSRLDEQQRRWYAAIESANIGHGGDRQL